MFFISEARKMLTMSSLFFCSYDSQYTAEDFSAVTGGLGLSVSPPPSFFFLKRDTYIDKKYQITQSTS